MLGVGLIMTVQVDKGIPVPESVIKRHWLDGFPLERMKVGESFLVPMLDENSQPLSKRERDRKLAALRMRVSRFNTKHKEGPDIRRFAVAKSDEERGYRVYRIQ